MTENANNGRRPCSQGTEASFPLWSVATPLLAELTIAPQDAAPRRVSRPKLPFSNASLQLVCLWLLSRRFWDRPLGLKPCWCFSFIYEEVFASYLTGPDSTCWTKWSFCTCTETSLALMGLRYGSNYHTYYLLTSHRDAYCYLIYGWGT